MASARHLPSVIGCAVGFCAAGSGVGSLVGMALGPWLYPPSPDGGGPPQGRLADAYGGTLLGIQVGMAVGLVAGVLYAVLVRRSRRRRVVGPDAEPGAAADPAS